MEGSILVKKITLFIGSAAHLANKPLFEAVAKVLSSLGWDGLPHLFANVFVFCIAKTKG